jgi:hypothetical protein
MLETHMREGIIFIPVLAVLVVFWGWCAAGPACAAQEGNAKSPTTVEASPAAQRGDFNAAVEQAKASYNAGDKLAAVEKLKEAVLSLWDEVPLTVKNVRLVKDTETYATRPTDVYAAGEPILMAAQLLGYKLKKVGEIYSIDIVTDFYVSDEKGEVLGGVDEFGKFGISSFIPTTDFRLDLTYTLTGAPPGAYNLQTIIHDKNSDKTIKFTRRIRIE